MAGEQFQGQGIQYPQSVENLADVMSGGDQKELMALRVALEPVMFEFTLLLMLPMTSPTALPWHGRPELAPPPLARLQIWVIENLPSSVLGGRTWDKTKGGGR